MIDEKMINDPGNGSAKGIMIQFFIPSKRKIPFYI